MPDRDLCKKHTWLYLDKAEAEVILGRTGYFLRRCLACKKLEVGMKKISIAWEG